MGNKLGLNNQIAFEILSLFNVKDEWSVSEIVFCTEELRNKWSSHMNSKSRTENDDISRIKAMLWNSSKLLSRNILKVTNIDVTDGDARTFAKGDNFDSEYLKIAMELNTVLGSVLQIDDTYDPIIIEYEDFEDMILSGRAVQNLVHFLWY